MVVEEGVIYFFFEGEIVIVEKKKFVEIDFFYYDYVLGGVVIM